MDRATKPELADAAGTPDRAPDHATPARRRLPAVDRLLAHAGSAALVERYGRRAVVDALRERLAAARAGWVGAVPAEGGDAPSEDALIDEAGAALARAHAPSLRPVLNLTGTVLHTNLGRALLPPEAADAVARVLTGASNLEFDVAAGHRGERDDHIEGLVCRLTGAEAATIVNNNAAAVLLVLAALTEGREVLVSRGELVEIGGAFRIPDVMARAGCRLREVGTTNRTHLRDYADAIGPDTAAAMKVHQSNYEIRGFTAAVSDADLGALCRERGVLMLDDLGSGNLLDLAAYGLPREPTVTDAVRHADVVTFSGDKLLGGVQCGLIAGRRDLIARIRKHPLKRALRVDKTTIAAMEAILRLYLDPDRLARRLPTLRLLTRARADIRAQAERLLPAVAAAFAGVAEVAVTDCSSQIGSGALPVETLPSAALALSPPRGDEGIGKGAGRAEGRGAGKAGGKAAGKAEGRWLNAVAERFRALPVPIIGRVTNGRFLLDLRTLEDERLFLDQIASMKA